LYPKSYTPEPISLAFSGTEITVTSFALEDAWSGTEKAGVIDRVAVRAKININDNNFV
jgi:hypothetical protein